MKTTLVVSLFLLSLIAFNTGFAVQEAAAVRNDRIVVCEWYRAQAQKATRRGNFEKADYYWAKHRACLDNRID